jgi:hypothetical protein
MYHTRRAVERIVDMEIMKLERRQTLARAGARPRTPPAPSPGRRDGSPADEPPASDVAGGS